MEEVKASSYVLVESRKLTVPCLDVMLFYRCKKIHNTNQPSFWWEAKRMRSAKYQRNKGERKPRGWGIPFTETSALTGLGVEGAFTALSQDLVKTTSAACVSAVYSNSETTQDSTQKEVLCVERVLSLIWECEA